MDATQVMDLDYTLEAENDADEERIPTIVGWIEIENKRHELKEGEVKIGRDPSTCKIVIDNEKTLSKEHALLEMDKTSVTLMDLGSRNKTRIGKMVLKPRVRYALQGGEVIKFGAVQGTFIVNEESRESDSDACSESVLDISTPIKKASTGANQSSDDDSVISPTPQVSTKNLSSRSKGTNATKSSESRQGNDKSIIVSPTPQTSDKNNISVNRGTNANRSLEFIPETPGNSSSILIGSGKEFATTQSTPFTSYARSALKGFTSPAFLSPISDMNSDLAKESLEGSPGLRKYGAESPLIAKLDKSSDNDEKEKEDYNSDESTDIEDFFADEAEGKKKDKDDESDVSVDICALPTQPFVRENVDSKIDASKINDDDHDDTQEILAAFGDESRDSDNTQEVLAAFEEPTQKPYEGEITEVATQQFDKTNSGTIFRRPFSALLKAKPKSSVIISDDNENADIFDAPTQIFPPGPSLRAASPDKSDSSDNEDIFNMPTQKFSSSSHKDTELKEDIIDAPTRVLGAPSPKEDIFDAPTQVFDAPTQVFEAPTQIFEAPTSKEDILDAPTQICDDPVQEYEVPTQVFEAPTTNEDIFDAPTQVFAPTQVGYASAIEDAPTQIRNAPPQVIIPPTVDMNISKQTSGSPKGIEINLSKSKVVSKSKNYSATNKNESSAKVINSSTDKSSSSIDQRPSHVTSAENEDENAEAGDDFEATQIVESDNEDEMGSNLPTVPLSSVLDKIETYDNTIDAHKSADSDEDTDSNASETLLQNEESFEDDELLEETQKFSYSLIANEDADKLQEENESKDVSKDNEEASKTDTEGEDSCASDTLLQINNEENKGKGADGYNSDESTDVEGDETIPFTKSVLNNNNDNINSVTRSSLVKNTGSTTIPPAESVLSKKNIDANVSSMTNETEVNDLSKLELTGDSVTLPGKVVPVDNKVASDVKNSGKSEIANTSSTGRTTYDSQLDTSEFGYSCFEIDSSAFLSDDSRGSYRNSPSKVLKRKADKKAITPSKLKPVADESFEIEEIEPEELDRSTKSQAFFDLGTENEEEMSDIKSHAVGTRSVKRRNETNKTVAQTSTPLVKAKKVLKLAEEESAESGIPSHNKVLPSAVDLPVTKNENTSRKDADILELPGFGTETQNTSQEISQSEEDSKDTSDTSESVKGTRLSRKNRKNKAEEESEISTNKLKTYGDECRTRQKAKPISLVDKKEPLNKQGTKRTRTTKNLGTSDVPEEGNKIKSKRLRATVASNSLNTEVLDKEKLQSSEKSSGRKRKTDSPIISDSKPKPEVDRNLLSSRRTAARYLKEDSDNQVNKREISKTEDNIGKINITPDEQPICNKPPQSQLPVSSKSSINITIKFTPEIKLAIRTTRRGRKSTAPSKYSPSKADLTLTADGKRSLGLIDTEDDVPHVGSKKAKVEKKIESKNKQNILDSKTLNLSDSNHDTNIVTNLKTVDIEKAVDTSLFEENKTNLSPEENSTNRSKKLPAQNTKKEIITRNRQDALKSNARTRSDVPEVEPTRAKISPYTQVNRVTRNLPTINTVHEEVDLSTKISKSVTSSKRKSDNGEIKNSKLSKSSLSKYSKAKENMEEDSVSVVTDKIEHKEITRDTDSTSSSGRASRDKSKKNAGEASISKEKEFTRSNAEVSDSTSVRIRSSRSTKAKENSERNAVPLESEVINTEIIESRPARSGRARYSKAKEMAEEAPIPEINVAKETTAINTELKDSKAAKSRYSKSKTLEGTEESSIALITDTKNTAKVTTKIDTDSIANLVATDITTVGRRGRRKANTEEADVLKKVDNTAKSDDSKLNETASRSRRSVATINTTEKKDKTLPVGLSRHSVRQSQRLGVEEKDVTIKDDILSVYSFSSESLEIEIKRPTRKRGRPAAVVKEAPAARKSTRRGKLVESASEMEMSIISESSLGDSGESNPINETRVKSNVSISPSRSSRSKRSGCHSPSFSKEEMLLSPARRQSMASKQPRVLFTSFKDAKDEKIVKDSGGKIAETASECTVLVTNVVKRTCKLLACVGKGVPIVSPEWLIASKQAKSFVDPWQYIISDAESEKKFEFSLKNSLKIAEKRKLLSGYSIHVTDSVKPPPEDMREIIECAGGEYLDRPPKINSPEVLVVSCEEDKRVLNSLKRLNVTVVNKEFILTGLLRQKMMIKEYKMIL